jgi:hypothetical protein
MIALTFFINLVMPLLLVLWMAGPWVASRLEGLALALMAASFAGFVFFAGPIWGWVGMGVRWVPVTLVVAGLVVMLRRWPGQSWLPSVGWRGWVSVATKGFVAAIFGIQFATSLVGLRPPSAPVRIAMPLEPGEYLVLNGGSTAALNRHHAVKAQRYAIDVVALDDGARRADGLMPPEMEDYAIYGRTILAPCEGSVLATSDGTPDTPIGGSDAEAPAGNFVALLCEIDGAPNTFLLAHMIRGSVAVAPGQGVTTGETLGLVGSSGNSSEPHLHIHAVAGEVRDLDALIGTAEPVPLAIGGHFLVRNETFGEVW